MGANEATSAIGRCDSSQRPEQVYDTWYVMQYAENQQPTQQQKRPPISIWVVQEGACIT